MNVGDLKCPGCGTASSKVVDSRGYKDHRGIRRRRECLSCQMRFSTVEVYRDFQTVSGELDRLRFENAELRDRLNKIKTLVNAEYEISVGWQMQKLRQAA